MYSASVIISGINAPYIRDIRDRSKDTVFLLECILNYILESNGLTHLQSRVYVKGKMLLTVDIAKAVVEQELFGSLYDLDTQIRRLKAALIYKLTVGVFRTLHRDNTVLYLDHIYINDTTSLFTINVIEKDR